MTTIVKTTIEDKTIKTVQGLSLKLEAAVSWAGVKYGDATVLNAMLCEIAAETQDFLSELIDNRKGGTL